MRKPKRKVTYELRTTALPPMPRFAVTKVWEIKFGADGEDVAWFFKAKDAEDYIKFKNGLVT